ncbi:MAG: DUF1302 family protein, partial [Desulfuromonadales bacterium]|nr:DUF1302 family protein [Desulfuromonadales bacterium]
YHWEETRIDPPGTYWSTNDFAGEGGGEDGTGVTLGFTNYPELYPAVTVGRAPTVEADDDGQYGIAMRLYAPNLNDTEFGFYFMNYHSRVPIISAITGSMAALPNYIPSAKYFTEYPEDIKLYGVSFNTLLTKTGIALQGEYSFRQDVPLQIDDVELLFAALSPLDLVAPYAYSNNQLGGYGFDEVIHGYKKMDISQIQITATKVFGPTFGADQFVVLGEVGLTYVHDMPSKDELRFESAGTYLSGNEVLSPYHGPVAIAPGGTYPVGPYLYEPADAFADETSWGYRMIAKLDFNNAIGAVTLSPRIAWKHDVDGNSPGPGGNFLEDRKAVTLGLGANYLNQWTADLSYT